MIIMQNLKQSYYSFLIAKDAYVVNIWIFYGNHKYMCSFKVYKEP